MQAIKTIIDSIRLPFLILTPVCVFLGVSTIVANKTPVDIPLLALTLLGALSAHISVNTLNEYFDFKSGLDLETKRTAFSGGSGALPRNPEMLDLVLAVGITTLVATLLIGIFFIWTYSWEIIPIGMVGILLIITYTQLLNKSPYLCLIAPGSGFGFLIVVGTQFVLKGHYIPLSWLVAFVPFFLINNLLLLNQYPDIQADANAGRHHFPIAYGVNRCNSVYALFALASVAIILIYVLTGLLPRLSLIALLPMPLALFALSGAIKYGQNIGLHPQYLGANVAVTLLVPLMLGISIIYGST